MIQQKSNLRSFQSSALIHEDYTVKPQLLKNQIWQFRLKSYLISQWVLQNS